jgi:DNA-directed RNA polymerase beta subunit
LPVSTVRKGVIGGVRPRVLPFLADSSVPDLIIQPARLPSRMTVAHVGTIGAKGACVRIIVDATPFTHDPTPPEHGGVAC